MITGIPPMFVFRKGEMKKPTYTCYNCLNGFCKGCSYKKDMCLCKFNKHTSPEKEKLLLRYYTSIAMRLYILYAVRNCNGKLMTKWVDAKKDAGILNNWLSSAKFIING